MCGNDRLMTLLIEHSRENPAKTFLCSDFMSANAVSLQRLQAAVESQLEAGRGAADQAVVSRQNMHPVRNHGGLCCGVGLAVRLHF